ncbi:RNase A-like domain-containing protein [Pantoea sp. SGAir0183]
MQSVFFPFSCELAEKTISSALNANRLKFTYWAKNPGPLELVYRSKTAIGYGLRQGSSIKETCSSVRVVLLQKFYNGKSYYVLTSYPWMG